MDLDLVSASVIVALNLGMDKSTKDAYSTLKGALRRKIDGDIDAVLKLLEENPASKPRRAGLREKIAATRAYEDDELNRLAVALLKRLQRIEE